MSGLRVGARSAWAEAAIEDFLRDYRAPLRVAGQGAGGFPLLCSLWSRYEAGVLWCASQRDAAIVRCLEHDPRCAFELAPNEPPYRGVRGRGRAAIHPDAGPRVLGELLERYQAELARFSEIAAANPHGWDHAAVDAATIRSARRIAAPYGKHHVSNWSVDQASAVLLTSADTAVRVGVPRDRWIFPQAFTEANHMVDVSLRRHLHRCIGAEIAGPAALDAAGCTVDDLDLIELNEAFAAQVLACDRKLELPMDRLNVNGGAIALGHPIGATGARIAVTLLHEMARRDASDGLATLCISGGQGLATAFHREGL